MVTRNEIRPYSPQHPGAILKAELEERGIKQKDFAEMIGMRPSHLNALLHGTRNISPRVAARIETALGISAQMWLNLQTNYDLDSVRSTNQQKGYTVPPVPEYALAQPNQREQKLWNVAFRAGQKDVLQKLVEVLTETGIPEETIKHISRAVAL